MEVWGQGLDAGMIVDISGIFPIEFFSSGGIHTNAHGPGIPEPSALPATGLPSFPLSGFSSWRVLGRASQKRWQSPSQVHPWTTVPRNVSLQLDLTGNPN